MASSLLACTLAFRHASHTNIHCPLFLRILLGWSRSHRPTLRLVAAAKEARLRRTAPVHHPRASSSSHDRFWTTRVVLPAPFGTDARVGDPDEPSPLGGQSDAFPPDASPRSPPAPTSSKSENGGSRSNNWRDFHGFVRSTKEDWMPMLWRLKDAGGRWNYCEPPPELSTSSLVGSA